MILRSLMNRWASCWLWATLGFLGTVGGPWGSVSSAGEVDFETQIRPLLSDRCYRCHGPDEHDRQAGLRLDEQRGALVASTAGEQEKIIVPGRPELSELMRRIESDDPDLKMPPPTAKVELNAAEVELIRQWIAEGAPWGTHWAFKPLQQPPLPAVSDTSWEANPIDRFVLARLEAAGRRPARAAARERLLRRITFDLTGLPPSVDELSAFLADESPTAYEKVVDRLLQSDRHAERMATAWLDIARYSDSFGYQVDRERFVWPWRDWVIQAFRRNMPYDEFITWQLAGDLLPNATDEQILATTFCRLHPQKVEGGSIPEEFRVEYVADRAQTFSTAFLGLTMECAKCHDHKYDPVTQRDFYQLFAYFNNIDEAGLHSYFTDAVPTPTLALTDEGTKQQLRDLAAEVQRAEQHLSSVEVAERDGFAAWLARRGTAAVGEAGAVASIVGAASAHATAAGPTAVDSGVADSTATNATATNATATNATATNATATNATATNATAANPTAANPTAANPGAGAAPDVFPGEIFYRGFESAEQVGNNALVSGHQGQAVRFTGDDGIKTDVGNFSRHQPFSISCWINTAEKKSRAVVFHRSGAWTDAGSRGYELLIEDGHLSFSLIHFWPGNMIGVRSSEPLPLDRWVHLVVTNDGSSRAGGLKIYQDGEVLPLEVVRDQLTKNITGGGGDTITLGERFRDSGFARGLMDEFRVFARQLARAEVKALAGQLRLSDLLSKSAEELTASEQNLLLEYYLVRESARYRAALGAVATAREKLCAVQDGLTEIMVMRELATPRAAHVLQRGAYDAPGERVEPAVPEFLAPWKAEWPANRLGLARWLTSPGHPLTARVAVNHWWQLVFGEGLVRTPEDFGSQGRPPTHPELLDWLAVDFQSHGWDVRRLIKLMVMSQTYRQDSMVDAASFQADPENLLWGRSLAFRWPAEMLRDNVLAMSGLLVERVGGAPAKPYELEFAFQSAQPDQNEGLYRRSLYTIWKRNGPAPALVTLDAANREVCQVRRERTSSPLQALVMMNGTQFVEAHRVLAERLLLKHGACNEALIDELFRLAVSRAPDPAQSELLLKLYHEQLRLYQENPKLATELLEVGNQAPASQLDAASVAALANVVAALANYDECVVRR